MTIIRNFGYRDIPEFEKFGKSENSKGRKIQGIVNFSHQNLRIMSLNPYLRHFGNVMERHLWTKNPQSHFWFWWRHTSINFFYFMLIWNLLSSTNCTPLGLITWHHHVEISCDKQSSAGPCATSLPRPQFATLFNFKFATPLVCPWQACPCPCLP